MGMKKATAKINLGTPGSPFVVRTSEEAGRVIRHMFEFLESRGINCKPKKSRKKRKQTN